MWMYQGVRLLPAAHTPAAQWLEMPVATAAPLVDDAGTVYGREFVLTEGFYVTVLGDVALSAALRWLLRSRDE